MNRFYSVISKKFSNFFVATVVLSMLFMQSNASAYSLCKVSTSGVNLSQYSAVVTQRDTYRTICGPSTSKRYGIASISKVLTSLTVLRLVDEGKISLDGSFISQLEPNTLRAPKDSRWNKVTVRQLLNHTSGAQKSKSWFFDSKTVSKLGGNWRSIAKQATSISLQSSPGAAYQYTNTNYILLGLLIEQKSGLGYSQAAENYVLKPLLAEDNSYRFASDYSLDGNDNKYYGYSQWKVNALGPAGGWQLTPKVTASLPIGFKRLLNPTTSAQAFKGSSANPNYGLGIMRMSYNSDNRWGHTGTILGVRASVTFNISRNTSGAVLYNGSRFSSGSDLNYASSSLSANY